MQIARIERFASCILRDSEGRTPTSAGLKLLALAVKRRGIDAQNPRRFIQRPRVRDNPPNMFGLDFFERQFSAQPHLGASLNGLGKIIGLNHLALGQNYRAFDHVSEFAEVSRPLYWRIAAKASGEKPWIVLPA